MKKKLVATAAAAVLAALLPFPTSAVPVLAETAKNPTTVGIRTASNGNPDNRGLFEYEILPKKSQQDSVAIYNYSEKTVSVRLLARDAASTPDGGFTAQESKVAPKDVGAWIALSKTELRMEPKSVTLVPFQIGVPYNATPGDHAGSILVSLLTKEPKAGGNDVVVEHRVGLRVYLRVPGALRPELQVQNLEASYEGAWKSLGFGRSEVSYTVRNSGNVRLSAEQQVEMLRSFGLSAASKKPEGLEELLPGGFARVKQEFGGTWAIGNVTARVTLTPGALDDSVKDLKPVVAEKSVFVLPWLLLLIVAVLIGLTTYGIIRRRRRPRRATGTRVAGRTPPRPAEAERTLDPVMATPLVPAPKYRLARGVLAAGVVAGLLSIGPWGQPAAHAEDAPLWKATLTAKSGSADDPIELLTSGGCPMQADSILAKVYGKGFPKDGQNVIGNTKAGVTDEGPFPAPLAFTMKEFMSNQPKPIALAGTYRFVVTCRTAKLPKSYGDYVAEIRFTSPTTWVAAKPVTNAVGPKLELDENGDPIRPGTGTDKPSAGTPSAGAPGAEQPGGDPAEAGPQTGEPELTAAEDSGGISGTAWALMVGGGVLALATVLVVARRSS